MPVAAPPVPAKSAACDCICLVGMPGSGKTTIGQLLAFRLGRQFLDVDEAIEREAGARLWEINDREGFDGLRRRERAANIGLRCRDHVISPGGSVIYSQTAMRHLKRLGRVVYLHVAPELLESRAGDLRERGVMIAPGMTYAELFNERDPLYRRWADDVIDCGEDDAPAVAERIADML